MEKDVQNRKKLWSEPCVTEISVNMTAAGNPNHPHGHPPGKSCHLPMDALCSSGQSNCVGGDS